MIEKVHTAEHSSAEGYLVNLALHDHAWFKFDNKKVCFAFEEATRGTSYSTSIKLFQKSKDERIVFFAIIN